MRKDLVEQYGEEEGGEMAARLVTDAMPLSPMDPSFLDMRDALIKAMDNRYHARSDFAALADTVFVAFSERGAGVGAATEGGNDTRRTTTATRRSTAPSADASSTPPTVSRSRVPE